MVKSPWDDAYVATAATGEKIPHPLWRKTNAITIEGQTVAVPEGMAYVPGGRFILGENKEESARPAHIVDLKPFFLEKFEVTNAQYMEFIKATGHAPPRYIKENEGRIPDGRQNHPVTCVRWDDAKAYCDWSGKRLPTEAEWEMAASWDPEKKVKFTYPWGDEPLDRQNVQGNYCFNWPNGDHGLGAGWPDWIKELRTTPATKDMMKAGGLTKAVGSYARGRSPFMCFDMGGNVAEWTADLFALYPGNNNLSERDKLLIAKQAHVQRGGSWRTGAQACSMRYGQAGVGSVPECSGFRCAADYPWKAPDGGGR
jgi:formylglycine-generating enzyme required for sulfatase activity